MTTRILFLGNSHLAALRQAHVADPARWPGISATFLGAHKDLLLQTAIRDGRLVPLTPQAEQAFRRLARVADVDIAGQDVIVLTGCMVAVASAATAARDMRWPGLPSLETCPDLAAMPMRLVSYPAACATVRAVLARRLGPQLARHLRGQGVAAPIWLTCQPRVSAVIRTAPRAMTRAQNGAVDTGDAAALSDLFDHAAARAMADAGADFLPQPPQTIAHHILTALPYVQGAVRLADRPGLPQPDHDIMHANAAYGAAVLDQIAARL